MYMLQQPFETYSQQKLWELLRWGFFFFFADFHSTSNPAIMHNIFFNYHVSQKCI